MTDKVQAKASQPEAKKADEKPQAVREPQAHPKDDAHQHKLDRLKRAIKPLEAAAESAHEQAQAGHVIAPTVTENVVKAAHEMALAAKALT